MFRQRLSSKKRKILTLEFSVGVTDVHSGPVPIETQDLRTNPLQYPQYVGLDGWVSMGGSRWVGLDGWVSMGGSRWVDLDGWISMGGSRWVDLDGWISMGGLDGWV